MNRNKESFNCETCQWGRHCDDRNPAPIEQWIVKRAGKIVVESTTCLLPMVSNRSVQFLNLFNHYKHHHLLISGGIAEQPNVYLTAMQIINGQLNESTRQ
ncbi:hypothetical protein [Pleionea sediminis]|uniref:hypothetical protein n=1 Tax=Pleionea sediminis TaxID=2569479 RepID=UPI00118720FC|nr:hypothetical protein [Pleionea sediminis]